MNKQEIIIAVLIPCYNESRTIKAVIESFREKIPSARIYVYDNNSTDGTDEIAKQSGAIVRYVKAQGKGNVCRRMFADIDADIYIMVDGDSTYKATDVGKMLEMLVDKELDMVTGVRVAISDNAYRNNHDWGNRLFNKILDKLFGSSMKDIFSGYRVFSHRFVKSFPSLSRGFEIETEICVHALELHLPYGEVEVVYDTRPEGSFSKLNTYKDGFRILRTMIMLFKETKPFKMFSIIAAVLVAFAFLLGYPLIITWLETGLVPRFPTAFIVVGLFIFAMISFTSGVILDGIAQLRRENKHLHYLKTSRWNNV